MYDDCEFIRQCEVKANQFKYQQALAKISNEGRHQAYRDPCLPEVPAPPSDAFECQFKPLPRHYLRKPMIETHPPLEKCEDSTTYRRVFYPRVPEPTVLVNPTYFHYKPTNVFTGQSTYNYSYRPYVVIEKVIPESIQLLVPHFHEKKKPESPSKTCETTSRSFFYKKEIPARDRSRLWWQKKDPYMTPTVQVESETTTHTAYKAPPYSSPIRRKIPRGNIYFGDYRLRS